MSDKMVLYSSEEAAKYVKNIEGWVDRNGLFFGNKKESESCARYSGCTHRDCEDCGEPAEKWRTVCKRCKVARDTKRYLEREKKEWDKITPLYSEGCEQFLFSEDEVYDFINEVTTLNQRIVICDPVKLSRVDEDNWCDELPEDGGELPTDIQEALNDLNELISESGAVSWTPGKYAAIVK